jgi:hypothetical protein
MRLTNLGNLHIGSYSADGGQRLQVQGDAFIKGSGNTSGTVALTLQNSDGTSMFRVNNAGSLLFGTAAPRIYPMDKATTSISLTGAGLSFFDTNTGSGNTFYFTGSDYIHTSGTAILLNATRLFWPTSGTGTLVMSNITPNINQTGGANGITRGLYVNPTLTAAADWRSIEWSNNSGWGLYGAGTANNYLGGKLVIGTTTVSTFALDVNGTARVSTSITSPQFTVTSRLDIFSDGVNGVISMQTLTNTLNLRKYVKVLGDDGGYGNNNASAAFQIDGTNRGFLPPRLTTTQKNAIGTPAAGLIVYDTDTNKLCCYNGTTWNDLF